jgi:hypothetical protein
LALMLRALVFALALAGCASPTPREAAEVMAPLIGCWRGAFEGEAGVSDERCFSVLDGRHVVDTHEVRPTGYAGETTYHLDEAHGVIVFAYASNQGGRSSGALRQTAGGLAFPAHTFRGADGGETRLRATWTFEGRDRFVAASEREENGAWRPFTRITYVRATPE